MVSPLTVVCLVYLAFPLVTCDLNDILKFCKSPVCSDAGHEGKYAGKEYNKKLLKIFTSGIPALLWEDIHHIVSAHNISENCKKGLNQVKSGLNRGDEWAFRVVDSSGKHPTAALTGSVTSLGDYDQCLDIIHNGFESQYCLIDTFPVGNNNLFAKMRYIDLSPFFTGICLPAQCQPHEVRSIIKIVLKPYPLVVEGDITCDTKGSISWSTSLRNLSTGKTLSLLFISVVLLLVFLGTASDIWAKQTQNPRPVSGFTEIFSAVNNTWALFKTSPQDTLLVEVIEWLKVGLIVTGTCGHIMTGLETPISLFTLRNGVNVKAILSTPVLQLFFNEAGLVTMTFTGGFLTLWTAYPVAKAGKLPYVFAIFNRWLKFIPSVLGIMALDYIWPLLGSGPFYTRIGNFNEHKCSKNWWKNIAMVNNLWGSTIDICCGHLYFLAVDMHLFILGLIAIFLLAKWPKAGILFGLSIFCWSNVMIYHNATKHETSSSLLVPNLSAKRIIDYLDYIHMTTYGYLPSYFFGILLGFAVKQGLTFDFSRARTVIVWNALSFIIGLVNYYSVYLNNVWGILSQQWVPLYIVLNRNLIIVPIVIFMIIATSIERNSQQNVTESEPMTEKEITLYVLYSQYSGNIRKALTRLSFAMYVSNYFFIRTDIFNERNLLPTTLYHVLKRIITSFIFICIISYLFHVVFVAPFDNIRKKMFSGAKSKQQ